MNKELVFILIIFFFTKSVFACSCIGQRTVKEEIKHSDAVMTGKIISKSLITLVDSTAVNMFRTDSTNLKGIPYETIVAKYELVIASKYKGKFLSDTVDIFTGTGGGDCGVNFEVGQVYIVYGEKKTYFGQINNDWPFPKGDNIIWTNICSRTRILTQDEISEIEKYKKRK